MPEPVLTVTAIAAISGAVGGATGKLVERGVDAGVAWIRDHFGKHGDEIQRRAEANTAEFLVDLSVRVGRIEARATNGGGSSELNERMASPDFSFTLQNALVIAARTSDSERHRILAQAVSSRLNASDGDVLAIADNVSVEILPRLSRPQLAFLGLHYGVGTLSQPWTVPEFESRDALVARIRELRVLYAAVDQLNRADYIHMATVGAGLHGGGSIAWPLENDLQKHSWQTIEPLTVVRQTEDGKWLMRVWSEGACEFAPSVVGHVLGAHVHAAHNESLRSG